MPRRPRRAPGLALALVAACFTGAALEGEPCSLDADCGPSLSCTDAGLCGQTLCTVPTVVTVPTFAPDITLIVTYTASMARPLTDDPDTLRWQQVTTLVDELAAALGDRVNLGLQIVPTVGPQTQYTPCQTDARSRILPAPDQGDRIADALQPVAENQKGEHALRAGIDLTLEGFTLTDPEALRPQAIVLISDGPLNCRDLATDLDVLVKRFDDALIPRVAEVAATGVPIYVVGVDIHEGNGKPPAADVAWSDIDAHLAFNALADAGGRPRPGDTHYYRADDPATVVAALAAVPPAFADCRVQLAARPVYDELLVIRVGPYRHHAQPDCSGGHGWRYTDADKQTVELCAATCADFRAEKTLTIEQRCPGI